MVLSSTKAYNICNPIARGKWLDIVIASIGYLRRGTSKVGFLDNSVEKNILHNDQEGEDVHATAGNDEEEVEAGNPILILC